jgi:signal-transduction protein with cAMP-binding, CBS, and nucleotidyltransferase domain
MFNLRRYEREAVTVDPGATALEIADRMDEESVGSVVVVDAAGAPLGIVTDRDLARRVLAAGLDPEQVRARDVMTEKLVVAGHEESFPRLVELCRSHGIRRIPLVKDARVVSVASLDDMIFELAIGLFGVADAMFVELREAARTARRRRRREARAEAIEELRSQLATLAHDARDRARAELAGLLGGPFGGGR